MTRTLSAVVVLVGAWSVAVGAQTPPADPVDGTWRINPARSSFSPGPPPRQIGTQIRRFATLEGGWHLFELTSVTPEGDPVFQSVAFKIDGDISRLQQRLVGAVHDNRQAVEHHPLVAAHRRLHDRVHHLHEWRPRPRHRPRGVEGRQDLHRDVERQGRRGREVHNVVVFDRVR